MKTAAVELSDGRHVEVSQLRWREAKRVKQAVIDALAQDVEGLLPLLDQLRQGTLPPPEALASVGRAVLSVLEGINETFVTGCLPKGFRLTDDLSYADWMALSSAVAGLNDIQDLLSLEKNSPAGRLVTSLWSRLAPAIAPVPARTTAATPSPGTAASKLDAFDPAGPLAT